MDEELINLAMITDKKYILSTVITIRSLARYSIKKNKYRIYLIADIECQQEWKNNYDIKIDNIEIKFVNVPEEVLQLNYTHAYVSKAAISKFFIANILCHLNKVLYIDGDILIRNDLKALYDIDLKGYYVAAVKDMLTYFGTHISEIGVDEYFNSGVMLLNLNEIRRDNVCNKLMEYKKHEKNPVFMDQDAFNVIMNRHVKFLSPRYNMIYECFRNHGTQEIALFYNVDKEDVEKPWILHMAGPIKPWTHIESKQYDEWFSYILSYAELAYCIRNFHQRDQEQLMLYTDRAFNQIRTELEQKNMELTKQLEEMQRTILNLKQAVSYVENNSVMLDYCIQQQSAKMRDLGDNVENNKGDIKKVRESISKLNETGICNETRISNLENAFMKRFARKMKKIIGVK